jgi:hypothetical protein
MRGRACVGAHACVCDRRTHARTPEDVVRCCTAGAVQDGAHARCRGHDQAHAQRQARDLLDCESVRVSAAHRPTPHCALLTSEYCGYSCTPLPTYLPTAEQSRSLTTACPCTRARQRHSGSTACAAWWVHHNAMRCCVPLCATWTQRRKKAARWWQLTRRRRRRRGRC